MQPLTQFPALCPPVPRAEAKPADSGGGGGGLAPGAIAAIVICAVVGVVVAVGLAAHFQCGEHCKRDGKDGTAVSAAKKTADGPFPI